MEGVLKTALRPKWIATLLGCLLTAAVFVLLSQWQFGRSSETVAVDNPNTETAVPLTEHFQPGRDMYVPDADQIVTAKGTFVPGSAVLVNGRLQDGKKGYWVVAAFLPQGAPGKNVIPVVRGWQPDFTIPQALPTGEVSLSGRLLPSESPADTRTDVATEGYPDVSAARLANVWDRDSYDGFIVIFTATQGAKDVGAASAGLEQVRVDRQPVSTSVNWLNIFYGVEWIVFAAFALYIWYRLVRDEYHRDQEFEAELEAWKQRQAIREARAARGEGPAGDDPAASGTEADAREGASSSTSQNRTQE